MIYYIDYIRLYTIGNIGASDYIYSEEDSPQTGGRELLEKPSTITVFDNKLSSKPELSSQELTKHQILKQPQEDQTISALTSYTKALFKYLNNDLTKEIPDYTEKGEYNNRITKKIQNLYSVFEKSVIYYLNQVEGKDTPIYSIINSYFIQDVLFIHIINSFITPGENTKLTINFDNDKGFEEIIKMRKVNVKTTEILNDRINNLKEKHKEILFGNKNLSGVSSQQSGGETTSISNIISTFDKEEIFPINTTKENLPNTENILEKLTNVVNQIGDNIKNSELYSNNENDIHSTIDNIITQSKSVFYQQMKKQDKNMKEYLNKAMSTMRRNDLYRTNYINECRDLFVSTINFLRKNFNANRVEFKLAQNVTSNDQEKLNPQTVDFVNNLLRTLTAGVLSRTKDRFLELKKDNFNNDGNSELYVAERKLLKSTYDTGKIEAKLDDELYEVFSRKTVQDKKSTIVSVKQGRSYYQPIIENMYNDNYYVINNALTTTDHTENNTDKDTKKVVNLIVENSDKAKLACPVTSVLDAQGTLGSCRNGKKSPNFIKGTQDITVNDDGFYEFNININSNNPSKTSINYYSIYGDFGIYDCNIVAEIGDKLTNILSANNTFKLLLSHIEEVFQNESWR